ncbi:cytochrome C biogenesis protein [Candidatus Micrarchaeota archaeon]|nr:cytochrome C biogenesis protein [Candidatus Micrarchaeota archaeon]
MADITYPAAFLAGLLSFLSPCVLPLIPAFLSYLSGVSLKEGNESGVRLKIFLNSLFFVLGFTLIFSIIGVILNGALGGVSYDVKLWLGRIGGVIIIVFGLFVMGLIRISFLEKEYKLRPHETKYSYLTSFVFGASFAVGWSPCVGAILGSILTLAFTSPGSAFGLLFAYSLGLGVPFLITGAFTAQASSFIKAHIGLMRYLNLVVGVFLIVLGILVFTDNLAKVANLAIAEGMLK